MVQQTNGTNKGTFLFTSESVGEGHPDKIALVAQTFVFCRYVLTDSAYSDQVSDAILDACLTEDPLSKVPRPRQSLPDSAD